jgi:glycosyltransferase involved in cell wall biosynthesis
MTILASIIVCTYNRVSLLRDTLPRLIQQTIIADGRSELILVDNNSSDGTESFVKSLFGARSESLRYIYESQQGLSFARNRGLFESQGRYIIFTDDDCLVDSDWGEKILTVYHRHDAACVFGKILPEWPSSNIPKWLSADRRFWNTLALLDYGDTEQGVQGADRLFYGANFSVRRDIFDKVGLFNTNLGRKGSALLGGEEVDLQIRMAKTS